MFQMLAVDWNGFRVCQERRSILLSLLLPANQSSQWDPMVAPKRFLVFHRNRLFRDCLSTFLDNEDLYDVRPFDHDADEWITRLQTAAPDIILLDVNLSDAMAVEVSRVTKTTSQGTKIILLVPDEHDRLSECMAFGIHGCVLERSSLGDLGDAITRVLAGERFCSPDIVTKMFAEIERLSKPIQLRPATLPDDRRLTTRELEVMELLNQRKSNKEIAASLCISLFTVKNHVCNILEKLNVDSRMKAVDVARTTLDLPTPNRD